mgnify:FL=1
MMELRTSKCPYCLNHFKPSFRLKGRQKTCGAEACRRRHRSRYQRRWRKINSSVEAEYQAKRKLNREKDFWKGFRRTHPEYEKRNRYFARLRKGLRREGLQRKLDIVQVVESPNKLVGFAEFATRHRSFILEFVGSDVPKGRQTHVSTGTSG